MSRVLHGMAMGEQELKHHKLNQKWFMGCHQPRNEIHGPNPNFSGLYLR